MRSDIPAVAVAAMVAASLLSILSIAAALSGAVSTARWVLVAAMGAYVGAGVLVLRRNSHRTDVRRALSVRASMYASLGGMLAAQLLPPVIGAVVTLILALVLIFTAARVLRAFSVV
jgi:hypothetical protein